MTTVAGLFDNWRDVQTLLAALEQEGIERSRIDLIANLAAYGDIIGDSAYGRLLLLGIPGIGPVLATEAIADEVDGKGLDITGGGFVRFLTSREILRETAELYAEGIRRGGTLVTVSVPPAKMDAVRSAMAHHQAMDLEALSRHYNRSGFAGFDQNAFALSPEEITYERHTRHRDTAKAYRPAAHGATPLTQDQLDALDNDDDSVLSDSDAEKRAGTGTRLSV